MAQAALRKNRAATGKAKLGALPAWRLGDLYPSRDAPELARDLDWARGEAKAFRADFAGKVAALDGAALGGAIQRYEKLDETLARIMSYASLTYAGNVSDPEIGRFFQSMQERANEISSELIFFALEITKLDDAALAAAKQATPALARYAPWLRDVRAFRDHVLADDMERLLHDKVVAGRSAWVRLYDETLAKLRFKLRGKELTEAETLHLLGDRNRRVREAAAHALAKVFAENIRLFAHVTNTLAKDKEVEDKWRKYPRPVSARNLANQVEDAVVDALVKAAQASFPRLSHRYYALKARWLKLKTLKYWDRNAPLPAAPERAIPWRDARETVLGAYARFTPDMAKIGQRFFDEGWIDAQVRPGKQSGAFSHPTVPSAHPYILLNYQGKPRDVMTLAHELGHGVHQVLAARQGHLMADTPLTLAETASVFGEMLTFRAMLDAETDPARKRAMLAGKVEDMLNTVVRQIAFYEFERRVHDERRQGELLPERLGEIFLAVQRESLGPAFDFDEEYKHFWCYIPHFIHSPFYVYAYAFGDCLVNSLYAVYQQADRGFAEKYLEMLKAGGTKRHKELLAPFGLDATDPAFWKKGLSVIEGFIDELEKSK
ncbi:MAG TPA: M3 family oligoendopeptidase [Alphaproteobacteria bacterium]|jgi:oligoendopeptidase F